MDLGLSRIRWVRLSAFAASALVAIMACSSSSSNPSAQLAPPSQQVLRVNFEAGSEPGTLDPVQQLWVYEAQVGRNVFEALLKAKADNSDVQGAAAQSYDISSDGLTYTFHLRHNGKWSDGKPVTAQDFVFGWKRLLDPRIAAPYVVGYFDVTVAGASNYSNVNAKDSAAVNSFLNGLGLSAPDPYTFVVKLSKPSLFFKWTTTLWLAAPERADMVAKAGSGYGAVNAQAVGTVIGNGPYMLSEVVPKDHITLVPNPYYRSKPKLQKVVLQEIGEPNVFYTKYQTGDLDMVTVPNVDAATVRNDPKLSKELHQTPTLLSWWIDVNVKKAPFDNQQVRLALAKGFDRGLFLQKVIHGVGLQLDTFIPKGMNGYHPELGNIQKFDPSAAKADLQAAGVSPSSINVPLLYNSSSSASKTASEFLQAQWQQNLGIKVTLEGVDRNTWTHRVQVTHDYSVAYSSGWSADYPDEQDWFDNYLTGSGSNFSQWSSSVYDNAVHSGDSGTNQSEREKQYLTAQKEILQQAPIILTYQGVNLYLVKPYVQGVVVTPGDDTDWYGDVESAATEYITKH